MRKCVHQRILGWISSGVVAGVFLGTQCSSWSRARRGPLGSSWGPVRSNDFILGIPGISVADTLKVRIGNQQAKYTSQIIQTCIHNHIPCMLENPQTSMLWAYPALAQLCNLDVGQEHVLHQCCYGTRWRKATRVQAWLCGHVLNLDRKCQGRKGICSITNKPHIVLSGSSKVHGVLWTSLAQKYPGALGRRLATILVNGHLAQIG